MSLFKKITVRLKDLSQLADVLGETDYYFTYIPIAWLPSSVTMNLQQLQAMQQQVDPNAVKPEQAAEIMKIQAGVLKLMIVDWNLVDVLDQPLPIPSLDEDSVNKLPTAVLLAMWDAMTSDDSGAEIPLANETASSPESTAPEPAATSNVPSPVAG